MTRKSYCGDLLWQSCLTLFHAVRADLKMNKGERRDFHYVVEVSRLHNLYDPQNVL